MNEQEVVNTDDTPKQHKNKRNFNWLKEYQWQKGQSGNPAGRPKEKTLKEFARHFLSNMSEDARLEFLRQVDADKVWEMAEGKAKQDVNLEGEVTTKIISVDE